jgi:AraC-like DNA-binding protein
MWINAPNKVNPPPWSPHGIVFPGKLNSRVPVERVDIASDLRLKPYIHSYWFMSWDLPLDTSLPVLAVPSCTFYYIFDRGFPRPPMRARIVGVRQTSYEFTISGKGRIMGVRFTPGGYSVFHDGPLAVLVDVALELAKEVPAIPSETILALISSSTLDDFKSRLDTLFLSRAPKTVPADFELLFRFFSFIADKCDPLTVSDVTDALGIHERRLQRIFDSRLGISPKSILRTRRFQAVADILMAGGAIDWGEFAQEMGYYDQSHLLNDFRLMTGWLPQNLRE